MKTNHSFCPQIGVDSPINVTQNKPFSSSKSTEESTFYVDATDPTVRSELEVESVEDVKLAVEKILVKIKNVQKLTNL